MRGFILYEGPSSLDDEPIAAIATLDSKNRKTGNMVQVWIIRSDIAPVEASKIGADYSVCGNCPQRWHHNGSCYVNLGQAPNSVYRSYTKGLYPNFDYEKHHRFIENRKVRLGAYGDPAAVPYEILHKFVQRAVGHTGYTHQAAHKRFDKRFFGLVMVSADSPKMALKMQSRGARTFRVALDGDSYLENEVECFSESKGLSCLDCMLCDGAGNRPNIAITVHGSRKNNFKTQLVNTVSL